MLVEGPGFLGLAGSSVGGGARLLELARLPAVCTDKLSIHFRLRLNPMACLRLVGHKLYIRLRLVAISDGVLEAGRLQTLHPITPSAISDGMLKACWAQTLHPITVLIESDGMFKACWAQTLHPIAACRHIRWCVRSRSATNSTSNHAFSNIRWHVKGLLGTNSTSDYGLD